MRKSFVYTCLYFSLCYKNGQKQAFFTLKWHFSVKIVSFFTLDLDFELYLGFGYFYFCEIFYLIFHFF